MFKFAVFLVIVSMVTFRFWSSESSYVKISRGNWWRLHVQRSFCDPEFYNYFKIKYILKSGAGALLNTPLAITGSFAVLWLAVWASHPVSRQFWFFQFSFIFRIRGDVHLYDSPLSPGLCCICGYISAFIIKVTHLRSLPVCSFGKDWEIGPVQETRAGLGVHLTVFYFWQSLISFSFFLSLSLGLFHSLFSVLSLNSLLICWVSFHLLVWAVIKIQLFRLVPFYFVEHSFSM